MTEANADLYVITAPSGAGKTSLVKALLDKMDRIAVSVSHTTRAMRPGEQEGVHYHFVDVAEFKAMLSENVFLEYAQVFDNYYGTSAEVVRDMLRQGTDVILEIDWQGAEQVRQLFPECISVFILPPSKQVLEERLRKRGQDDESVIAKRLQGAAEEMQQWHQFDYLIVNDDFDVALEALSSLVLAQRHRLVRQKTALAGLLHDLVAQEI